MKSSFEDGALSWLESWYVSNCDGDWEHEHGVRIDTLDNPGWSLEIDLNDTDLSGRPFPPVEVHRTETDWVVCRIESAQFKAVGGPLNLLEIVQLFRDWATKAGSEVD